GEVPEDLGRPVRRVRGRSETLAGQAIGCRGDGVTRPGLPRRGAQARPRPVGVGPRLPRELFAARRGLRGARARTAPCADERGTGLPRTLRHAATPLSYRQ